MLKTEFEISKMDCPSEEGLIRLKLQDLSSIKKLDFDLVNRKLFVFHEDDLELIETRINELNLGTKIVGSKDIGEVFFEKNSSSQRKLLLTVLGINFAFFIIEMTTGIFSKSMGLVADSLDMLADSFVYGLSLFAVGGSLIRKKRIAITAGYFQILLALVGFIEVLRRFFGDEELPNFETMIIVSILALVANGVCLYLLQREKSEEAHMQASMIFTSNDVIINLGVILAGVLVFWFNSNYPDLIIGTVVFLLVIKGAIRILKLGN